MSEEQEGQPEANTSEEPEEEQQKDKDGRTEADKERMKADKEEAKEKLEAAKKAKEKELEHKFESYEKKLGSKKKAGLLVERDIAKEILAKATAAKNAHDNGAQPLNKKELEEANLAIEKCQEKLAEITAEYRKA